MDSSASRGEAQGTPAQNYQALGIFTTARTGKRLLFRDTVHRAARKVTALISLVQAVGLLTTAWPGGLQAALLSAVGGR